MQLKNGTKLRRYIFMQQLLIGIVQGLLTVALVPMEGALNKFMSGFIAIWNFVASIVLVAHFGVHLYPAGDIKQHYRAMYMIGASFALNFIALCVVVVLNKEENLTVILTFMGGYAPFHALALFIYITVYITLLLSIGFATYCLIDACEIPPGGQQTAGDPEDRIHMKDVGTVSGVYLPSPQRHDNVLINQYKIDPEARRSSPRHQRKSSRASLAPKPNAKHQTRDVDSDSDGPIRGRPCRSRGVPMPPTPPPLPPPGMWAFPINRHTERFRNLNDEIAYASRRVMKSPK